jgi:hypothetical protein
VRVSCLVKSAWRLRAARRTSTRKLQKCYNTSVHKLECSSANEVNCYKTSVHDDTHAHDLALSKARRQELLRLEERCAAEHLREKSLRL